MRELEQANEPAHPEEILRVLNLILKTGAIVGGVGINEPDSDAIAIVFLLQRFEAFKTLLGDRATGGGEK